MATKPIEIVLLMRDSTRQAVDAATRGAENLSRDYAHLAEEIRRVESEMNRSGSAANRTVSDYDKLQSALKKIAGTAALAKFGKDIIDVRGELEMLDKSFEVLTGSAEASKKTLAKLKDYAIISPLTLKDISSGAQLLMGYNLEAERTVEVVKQIGDISMGDSGKFQSLLLAYSQMMSLGQVVSQDLRQMATAGFNPLVEVARTTGKALEEVTKEMHNGAISVEVIQEAFRSATAEGGKFYQMSEKQAEGLVGMRASLEDAWMNTLNDIGAANQELIAAGYKLSTSFVQNYDKIGKILLSLITTYGTYKAAVLLNIVVEQGWMTTQMQLGVVAARVNKIFQALNATMMKHPAALVAGVVVGLVTAIWALKDSTTAEEKALKELNDEMDRYKQKADERKNKADNLIRVIKDETEAEQAKLRALKDLQMLYPEVFSNMDLEAVKLADEIDLKKKRNLEEEKFTKEKYKQIIAEAELRKRKSQDIIDVTTNPHTVNYNQRIVEKQDLIIAAAKKSLSEIEAVDRQAAAEKIETFDDQVAKARENVKKYREELKNLQKGIRPEGLKADEKFDFASGIEAKTKQLKELEGKLSFLLTGKDKNTISQEENAAKSAAEKAQKQAQEKADSDRKLLNNESKSALERRQATLDNEQKLLDTQEEGFDKRQKQIELDYQKELLAIDKHAQELIERQQEAEKLQWEKNGKNGVFSPQTTSILTLPREQKNELITQEATLNKTDAAATAQLLKDQLEPYRTFAQKRIDIEKKYREEIAALRESGAQEENIQIAEQAQSEALAALDEEMAQKEETFKALMMRIGYMSLQQLEKALKEAERALAQSESTGGKNSKETGVLRAKVKKLTEEIKAVKAEEETKNSDPTEKWNKTSKAIKKCKEEIDGMLDSMDFLDESTKSALQAASNVATGAIAMIDGIQKLSEMASKSIGAVEKASVILAIIGAAVQIITAIFSMASAAENRHQEALAEVQKNRIAMQREYNLLLLEQNLLLKEATTIFGEKQIEKAANAMKDYQTAINLFKEELKGDAPKMNFFEKSSGDASGTYQKRLDAYNQGIGALSQIKIKTGHHKTGLFGWGKGKDEYTSILKQYDDLLTSEGKLNIERAKAIISTQTMSEENKDLLQSLVDLQEAADEAEEALRDYLQETFGDLGEGLMDSLVASIQDKGVDAWETFGDAGAKVIEKLGEQLAYELFFADKFAKLQKDLKAIYDQPGKSSEDIASEAMQLVGDFYNNIGNDMDAAQAFMEGWKNEAEKRGFDLWQAEGSSQSGQAGGFTSMTQDQGTKLEGLFTSVQNHTANIDLVVTDMAAAMYNSLDCLMRIEENTSYCKRLESIAEDIAYIKRDGLKMK
jgi:tape measure domain-containing protein